jgi:hypothetical protein
VRHVVFQRSHGALPKLQCSTLTRKFLSPPPSAANSVKLGCSWFWSSMEALEVENNGDHRPAWAIFFGPDQLMLSEFLLLSPRSFSTLAHQACSCPIYSLFPQCPPNFPCKFVQEKEYLRLFEAHDSMAWQPQKVRIDFCASILCIVALCSASWCAKKIRCLHQTGSHQSTMPCHHSCLRSPGRGRRVPVRPRVLQNRHEVVVHSMAKHWRF